jgi:stress response protein YsnF
VTVQRIPVGRPVEVAPEVREEDGVLIVPVLEERLVVMTELFLKEEIRITKKSRTEIVREPVRLRSERAEIERLQGRDLNNPNVEERDSDGRSNPDRDV